MSKRIRIGIAGVGNCASALVQGLRYYGRNADCAGVTFEEIGGYTLRDIDVTAAFDVDERKVGRPIEEAIRAAPNCTTVFLDDVEVGTARVEMGPVLDGVSTIMSAREGRRGFVVADQQPVDVREVLRSTETEVLVCMLPVGSERAVRHYACAALDAGVGFINCVPVFVGSEPEWIKRFESHGLPIVGDDIKSQVGATIVHRALVHLLEERGSRLSHTYQLNIGGNTDFLNMTDQRRLASKRESKTAAVQAELREALDRDAVHVGPAAYVPWQGDNKVAFVRMEWEGFGGITNHLDLRLSVEDSPNCAGVVVDAIRCAKVAMDCGVGGSLEFVSAWAMKRPPRQVSDHEARLGLVTWLEEMTAKAARR